jgi:hypothetical protein
LLQNKLNNTNSRECLDRETREPALLVRENDSLIDENEQPMESEQVNVFYHLNETFSSAIHEPWRQDCVMGNFNVSIKPVNNQYCGCKAQSSVFGGPKDILSCLDEITGVEHNLYPVYQVNCPNYSTTNSLLQDCQLFQMWKYLSNKMEY